MLMVKQNAQPSECHKCSKKGHYSIEFASVKKMVEGMTTSTNTAIAISRSMMSIKSIMTMTTAIRSIGSASTTNIRYTRSGCQVDLSLIHVLVPLPLVITVRREIPIQKQVTSCLS